MHHINVRFAALLLAVAFSACGHAAAAHNGFAVLDSGDIALKKGAVVIKLRGHDRARVDAAGRLSIGGSEVALSPPAQQALARYNADAVAFDQQARRLGLDSAGFALHTIGQVFQGVLQGNADQAGQEADQGSQVIEASALRLCQSMEQWRQAQDAAAALAPEFRPYAVISREHAGDCAPAEGAPEGAAAQRQISS